MSEESDAASGAPGAGVARWIDSHCHLQDQYRPEGMGVEQTVAEAVAAGVRGLVCVGTDAGASRQAVALVRGLRAAVDGGPGGTGPETGALEAWATVGLHPHEASHGVAGVEQVLLDALAEGPDVVVAVGECGLDYHYDHSPRHAQRAAFASQVSLARAHGLSLVVHTREAWDDTIDVLRAEGPPERTVMHCFTGGPDEARRCLDLGAYLSFSGIVTFKGAQDVRDAAGVCPVDRLLVETDAPFLAPVPHRGQQNRPAWVATVGTAVALIRGVAPEALAETSVAATRAAFALS